MGNDHTGSFELTSYGIDVAGRLSGHSASQHPSAEAVREWLAAEADGGRPRLWESPSQAEPALQHALRFSYDLYEHADLRAYQLDFSAHASGHVEVFGRKGVRQSHSCRAHAHAAPATHTHEF